MTKKVNKKPKKSTKTDKNLLSVLKELKQAKAFAYIIIDDCVVTGVYAKDGKQPVRNEMIAGCEYLKRDILNQEGS
jgi:hypothetical protein